MATTKLLTDKIKGLPTVTDLTGHTLLTADSGGSPGRLDADLLLDGVFIMYSRRSDGYQIMARPTEWTSLQDAGETAIGVTVIEGGKILIVAPTEADSAGLLWSSRPISGGATTTGERHVAINDWNGKANTASIIASSTSAAVTNSSAYAPGFCNLYARMNTNGVGLTAGRWWLPALGEMVMIYANMAKINHCLGLISGATLLAREWYLTSTEFDGSGAWGVHLGLGYTSQTAKGIARHRVRPVATFL